MSVKHTYRGIECHVQKAGVDRSHVVHAETNLRYTMRGSSTGFKRYIFLITLVILNIFVASYFFAY